MKSTPDIITELRASLGLPVLRKDEDVLRAYRFLLARAIVICDFSRLITRDDDDFLVESHKLLNDTIKLVFSDPVVERFDQRAKNGDQEQLMELARRDARTLPLEALSIRRLRDWKVS